jgi:type I restriction-modification system DNA methylase subunit
VIEERLQPAKTKAEKEAAILSIRVCDPAAGSGHFLLAAARRLGKELARVKTGEDEPAPERVREAIRDVVAHCIYGVDKNPLAVELCRVALWLEAHAEGKPLTFLTATFAWAIRWSELPTLRSCGREYPTRRSKP